MYLSLKYSKKMIIVVLVSIFILTITSVKLCSTDAYAPISKTAYLTFDDGPSKNTVEILDVLKKYKIKATFFVIGKDDEISKEIVKRIVSEGHSIGIHTFSHKYEEIYAYPEAYMKDFNMIVQYIKDVTGVDSKIMRFPGGSRNRNASRYLMDTVKKELAQKGYIYFDWDIVSGDDRSYVLAADELVENVLQGAEKKDDIIVLFHDAPLYTTTPKAVDLLINKLKNQGYKFDRITVNTPPLQFGN